MERWKQQSGIGPIIRVIETWPRLTAWAVLSLGCISLLVYEARDVGLSTGNWVALIVATIAVAGLCIWIVGAEDPADDENVSDVPDQPDANETA